MVMATYKVIQDIEAEDKLLGPLTLRQFIYGAIAAVCLYLSYYLASKGAAFMMVIFLPVALGTGFFAFPWGRDQPTEVWALAKIRFALKPRRRIWNQSGIKELVTITAPKHVPTYSGNNLSQEEVRSRLQALASTIDTRGWAVKNAGFSSAQATAIGDSDRLIAPSLLPKPVDDVVVQASEDILDEQNNAGAQRLQSMIDQSSKAHRDKLMQNLQSNEPAPAAAPAQQPRPANYWFLNQPGPAATVPKDMVTFNTQVVTPGADSSTAAGMPAAPVQDEASLVAELEEHKRQSPTGAYYGHMHTIKPLSEQAAPATPPVQPYSPLPPIAPVAAGPVAATPTTSTQTASAPVTPPNQAAILQLASNDDLNVATIAREAERSAPQDEVVIKLH